MCGIGGFSLSSKSKLNARKVASALLSALEDRGNMASGFAYHHDGEMGYFKQPVSGSHLSLKKMPRKARSVIVHTRLATHGSIDDNRNNHPVLSPNQEIALVHNGVIYNHKSIRGMLKSKIKFEVDTAVIPALLQDFGTTDKFEELDGDAAVAWLDKNDIGTLHLARVNHSPTVVAQVEDGSFIFASTESLLWRVLIQLDLMPEFMHTLSERQYIKIRDGVIVSSEWLPELKASDWYDRDYFRYQTAGAKGAYKYSDVYSDYGDDWMHDVPTKRHVPLPAKTADGSAPSYFIEYSNAFSRVPQYAFYSWLDVETWEYDLEMFEDDDNLEYTLLDYGWVEDDGTLISERMPSAPPRTMRDTNTSCSVNDDFVPALWVDEF